MATAEMAAMLDELMGRNRNAMPNEKLKEMTWEDDSVCKYYLVDFCPHDIFVNTKVDLGPCPNVHDEELKRKFHKAELNSRKTAVEDDFIRFCQKMVNDLGHKIRRSKERLKLTQLEQAAAAGISPQEQAHVEEQISVLTEKINVLVDKAEKAGCEGDVEEAQGVLKLCDQLREEREQLKKQIGMRPLEQMGPLPKPMEVCEICGSFLIINDAQSRIDDHINGKQHAGYSKLKNGLEKILEIRRERREERDKKSGEEGEVRDSKDRESKDRSDRDSKSRSERDSKSRSERDSKSRSSRDRRSRSRSRDRRRRSRSRDHKRRSRSRDRSDRRRSRSRDRDRRGRDRRY